MKTTVRFPGKVP
ncbi:rCG53353 [Rattus norvegicus]|uniref:RCG53353 n=1 Tax=Rattus norvegicus TaxID=10116 RepID=A6JN07_RAT|nr:rCG53353 [Rattus norvegicus]